MPREPYPKFHCHRCNVPPPPISACWHRANWLKRRATRIRLKRIWVHLKRSTKEDIGPNDSSLSLGGTTSNNAIQSNKVMFYRRITIRMTSIIAAKKRYKIRSCAKMRRCSLIKTLLPIHQTVKRGVDGRSSIKHQRRLWGIPRQQDSANAKHTPDILVDYYPNNLG